MSELSEAVKTLVKHLKEDESYRYKCQLEITKLKEENEKLKDAIKQLMNSEK